MASRSACTVVASASLSVCVDFCSDRKPSTCTKPSTSSVRLPLARVSSPRLPSLSSVMVLSGPLATSYCRNPWSSTMSSAPPVPLTPRLISTLRSLALAVKPSSPTTPMLPAVAFSVVKLRGVAVLPSSSVSLASSRPKSTSLSDRPIASAVPPFRPANACTPLPPMVSTRAWISVGAWASSSSSEITPSLRKKLSSLLSIAKPPLTWKKPKTSSSRLPEARSSRPCAPSIVSPMLLPGPVATLSAVRRPWL